MSSPINMRSDGMVSWISVNGCCGTFGVLLDLPDTVDRAEAAQASNENYFLPSFDRTHRLQTLTSDLLSKVGRRFRSTSFFRIMVDSDSTVSLLGSAQRKTFAFYSGRRPDSRRSRGGCISSLGVRSQISACFDFGFPLNNSMISFSSLKTDGDAPHFFRSSRYASSSDGISN